MNQNAYILAKMKIREREKKMKNCNPRRISVSIIYNRKS